MKTLEKKSQDAEAALQATGRSMERVFMQAQQKVQQGLLTPNQVQQEEQRLTHAAAKASEASFAQVWDNDEDAAYDRM